MIPLTSERISFMLPIGGMIPLTSERTSLRPPIGGMIPLTSEIGQLLKKLFKFRKFGRQIIPINFSNFLIKSDISKLFFD